MCRRFSTFRWEGTAKSSVVALQRELKNKCTLSRTHLAGRKSPLCVFVRPASAQRRRGGWGFYVSIVQGGCIGRQACCRSLIVSEADLSRKTHLCGASPLPIPSSHVFMTMGCWLARERGISFSLPASCTPLSLHLSLSHTQCGKENKAKQSKLSI
jgi:hypothetical protein